MKPPKEPHTLTWHLAEWMAYRDIVSFAELGRALSGVGYTTTAVHAARLAQIPSRLSLPMLDALCQVLGCTPGDLVRGIGQPPPIKLKPKRTSNALPEPAPQRLPDSIRARVVGPAIRALQAHALARPPQAEEDEAS